MKLNKHKVQCHAVWLNRVSGDAGPMALCGLLVSRFHTWVFILITYTGKLWSNSLQLGMDKGNMPCTIEWNFLTAPFTPASQYPLEAWKHNVPFPPPFSMQSGFVLLCFAFSERHTQSRIVFPTHLGIGAKKPLCSKFTPSFYNNFPCRQAHNLAHKA